jgi:thiosulfate/3-mercaptopyruvate sulfurtransferase
MKTDMSGYACPDVLVSTDWVKKHLDDPKIKVVEIDVDSNAYEAGHIPGAIGFDWSTQLNDPVRRDIISREELEKLLGEHGIRNDDTIVVYGDNNNWFAAFGFWILKLYGHEDVRLMNGGRQKWLNEDDKPMTADVAPVEKSSYRASEMKTEYRARVEEMLRIAREKGVNLVDVRSPDEFTGKIIAPPGMSETAQRGGHIPGAKNIPWSTAVNPDGTFKPVEELRRIYLEDAGVDADSPTIAYCRIGERSSHTWFVLKYLLGIEDVRNYDGSWTEYGNLIGAPIEKP